MTIPKKKQPLEERVKRLVRDAVRYWRRSNAVPVRGGYGTKKCCCLVTAAFYEHHPDSPELAFPLSPMIEEFVAEKYDLTHVQVLAVIAGFDSPISCTYEQRISKKRRDTPFRVAKKASVQLFDENNDPKLPVRVTI